MSLPRTGSDFPTIPEDETVAALSTSQIIGPAAEDQPNAYAVVGLFVCFLLLVFFFFQTGAQFCFICCCVLMWDGMYFPLVAVVVAVHDWPHI